MDDRSATPAIAPHDLVGTYQLLSVVHETEDGERGHPFGEAPIGFMAFTSEGYMFATMMWPNRPNFAEGDILGGTAEERAEAFSTASSFVCLYRLDGGEITFDLAAATYPNWVGTTQVRHVELRNGRLTLTTPMLLMDGVRRRAVVTLQQL